jgi:RNA polymerase sigma factor (sigma-70 family)
MNRQEATRLIDGLFDTWGPCLLRHAWRLTGRRPLAEELVQEAFFALYRELRAGAAIANPRAWTLTVVRYQAAKQARTDRRHPEQSAAFADLDAFAGPAGPVPFEHQDVAELLAGLTTREEEVLLLRLESLKYREIGEQLGITDKSVATLLARALRKLQAAAQRRLPGVAQKERHVPKTLQ